jgi:hypothetical protein
MRSTEADASYERAVASSRTIAAVQVVTTVALAGAAALLRAEPRSDALVTPAAVLGIVAPAFSYHLYRRQQRAASVEKDPARRVFRFRAGTWVSIACTECAALVGIVAFYLSGETLCLVGVLMHLLLTGAVWPTEERLRSFLEMDP